jgi:hypothetical protein
MVSVSMHPIARKEEKKKHTRSAGVASPRGEARASEEVARAHSGMLFGLQYLFDLLQ